MLYVICPTCEARVEIPASACGPDRVDLYNVTQCDECGAGFDYDDDDVMNDDDPATARAAACLNYIQLRLHHALGQCAFDFFTEFMSSFDV